MGLLLRADKVGEGKSEILLDAGNVILGSLPSNNLVIVGNRVDPIHAMIEVEEELEAGKLIDMMSQTGVKLNGRRIDVVEDIKPGDIIEIGDTRIEVLFPEQIQSIAPPPPPMADGGPLRGTRVDPPPPPPGFSPSDVGGKSLSATQASNAYCENSDLPNTGDDAFVTAEKTKERDAGDQAALRKTLRADKGYEEDDPAEFEPKNKAARINYGHIFKPGHERPQGTTLEVVALWGNNILDVRHYGGTAEPNENPRPSEVFLGNEEDGHIVGVGPHANTRNYRFAAVQESKTSIYLDKDMQARVRRGGKFEVVKGPEKVNLSNKEIAIVRHGPLDYFLMNVVLPNPKLRKFEDLDGKTAIFLWFGVAYIITCIILIANSHIQSSSLAADDDPWSTMLVLVTPTPKPTPPPKSEATPPPAFKAPQELPKPEPPKRVTPAPKPPEPPKQKKPPVKAPPTVPSLQKPQVPNKKSDGLKGESQNKDKFLGRPQKAPPGQGGGKRGGTTGKFASQRAGTDKADGMGAEGGKKGVISGINFDALGKDLGKTSSANGIAAIATGLKSSSGGAGAGMGSGSRNSHGFGGLGKGTSLGTGGPDAALNGLGGGAGGLGAGGLGGKGSGGSFNKKMGATRVEVPQGDPAVEGGLTKAEIEAVIKANLAQIKACYERNLQGNRGIQGRVATQWVIGSDGRVRSSDVVNSTLGHSPTETCIVQAIRRWKFPFPRNGSTVNVNYPFNFMPRS